MMTSTAPLSLYLASEDETTRLGFWFGERLASGDTLLLEGPIGSGKSHLARAILHGLLGREEDVPSPTFTLVQTYDLPDGTEAWHADLYRLTQPDEVSELGLEQAFDQAICLVEWPDRLGSLAPKKALTIRFAQETAGRRLYFEGGPSWSDRLRALSDDWHG